MRIVFMGTPEFSVFPLQSLIKKGHEVLLVVTQPDKANNRGNKINFSPVKQAALDIGLQVAQPEKVKNNESFLEKLKELNPDCIVVSAYGKILPKDMIEMPKYGCINIHGSLLPKYRGAAPIQWSIINGDEFTGVSIMKMEEGLDSGPVYMMGQTVIGGKNILEMYDELSKMGASLLIETLEKIETGVIETTEQDQSLATYARLLKKEDGELDFLKKPIELVRLIRGLNPFVKTYTEYKGIKLIISYAEVINEAAKHMPGTIIDASKEGIKVACGGEVLLIKKIQFPGKKEMTVADYLVGNKIELFEVLNSRKES